MDYTEWSNYPECQGWPRDQYKVPKWPSEMEENDGMRYISFAGLVARELVTCKPLANKQ
jgi:hypothetical protein